MLDNNTRRKWTTIYDEINNNLDKLSKKELNYRLKSKIEESDSHTHNMTVHITEAERIKWNNFKGYQLATETIPGLISAQDKMKLQSIAANANNYVHPKYTGKAKTSNNGITFYKINDTGHICDIDQRQNINNIKIENSNALNGYSGNDIFKVTENTFLELYSPDINFNDQANGKRLINQATFNKYKLDKAVQRSINAPEKSGFWLTNDDSLSVYNTKNKSWIRLRKFVDLSKRIVLNGGKIPQRYLPKIVDYPLGFIVTTLDDNENVHKDKGFLPCDGRTLTKTDYPDLYDAIIQNAVFVKSKPEYDADINNTGSCLAFTMNGEDIILPYIHFTTFRSMGNYSISNAFSGTVRRQYWNLPWFNAYSDKYNSIVEFPELFINKPTEENITGGIQTKTHYGTTKGYRTYDYLNPISKPFYEAYLTMNNINGSYNPGMSFYPFGDNINDKEHHYYKLISFIYPFIDDNNHPQKMNKTSDKSIGNIPTGIVVCPLIKVK